MTPAYNYTTSIEYINGLKFHHIETYSMQRGAAYEEELKQQKAEHDRLEVKQYKNNGLSADQLEKLEKLTVLTGYTQYLLNEQGQLHWSAQKTNTFQAGDNVVERLKKILTTEIKDVPYWMCAPIYRDAIVFYDKDHNIVSVLNICFECEYMAKKAFDHINADRKAYELLKKLFLEIGHDMMPPELDGKRRS